MIDLKGKLPACVLSDMWGRFWNNLYKDVVPYPDRPSLDVSDAMKEQGYDVKKMFQSADDFYAGMGLERVNDLFWKNSMLEKPKDGRKVVCHATAWDFFDAKVSLKHDEKYSKDILYYHYTFSLLIFTSYCFDFFLGFQNQNVHSELQPRRSDDYLSRNGTYSVLHAV